MFAPTARRDGGQTGWLVSLYGVLLLFLTAGAQAQSKQAFDPSQLDQPTSLAPFVQVLRDPGARLTLADVQGAEHAQRFVKAPSSLSFGFTNDAVWARFAVDNQSALAQRWILEIGYPILDYVTLYEVTADGRVQETLSGDMRPFSSRETDETTFTFPIQSEPDSRSLYYVRVQTSGSLRLPLMAYHADQFNRHTRSQSIIYWLLYGALLVMALFNFGVFGLIRQAEYFYYALTLLTLALIQFNLAGHTSQYLFDNSPELANRTLPFAVALLLLLIAAFANASFRQFEEFTSAARVARVCFVPALAVFVAACLLPSALGLRVSLISALGLVLLTPALLIQLLKHRNEQLRLYLWSWFFLVVMLPIHGARAANWLPGIPAADWAIQVGIAGHALITSLALATRLQVAREQLGRANAQLSANVARLQDALLHAERATEAAKQATLAKDQFVATMSHELRTPLNAIINVPQGLLDDIAELPGAVCDACNARFLLQSGETIYPGLACAACSALGSLRAETRTKFLGQPEQLAHFLRKIERSGKHLLHMVDSVLDLSKLDAGRLELSRAHVDVDLLLRETLDEVSGLAAQRKLALILEQSGTPTPLWADPVRIKQVLLNLLSNAIKFSEPEGTVNVHWQCEPQQDVISVRDQGIGIAPEDQTRVFESFEQVHTGNTRKYGGTGLGLSISRSLVQMHGGKIWVDSVKGKGSTFSFSIPRVAELRSTS